jgi:hypothetical protein
MYVGMRAQCVRIMNIWRTAASPAAAAAAAEATAASSNNDDDLDKRPDRKNNWAVGVLVSE